MRRREFLVALGCAAAAWPVAAKAQQHNGMRRVGVLTGGAGPDSNARVEVFRQALAQLGWTVGGNLQLEIRQGGAATIRFAGTLQNWSRSRRTSS
jgi:putative ABC transport system substrate-binding protein